MTADPAARPGRSPVQRALLSAVGFYQRAISPTRPPRCRFVPTCSDYAVEAIDVHGAVRGGWLALRRLLKCAPWHPGGIDLVPPARNPRPGTSEAIHSSNTAARTPAVLQDVTATPAAEGQAPRPAGSSFPARLRSGPAAGGLR